HRRRHFRQIQRGDERRHPAREGSGWAGVTEDTTMRNRWLMWLLVIVFGICVGAPTAAMQSSKSEVTGTWTGTWDGAGSGDFELTLDTNKDGAIVGRVAVTTDGGNYTADLKDVVLEGK